MSSQPPVTVCAKRRFAAPPERVFDAWLDPAGAGCEVVLRHERVWAGYEARTAQGWTSMLDAAARRLGS